jgi:hypothetical protein
MVASMELIVDGFVRLKDRQALEDLRMHRQRLSADLKAVTDVDCRSSIAPIDQKIAIIEVGLSLDTGQGRADIVELSQACRRRAGKLNQTVSPC